MHTVNIVIEDEDARRKPDGLTWRDLLLKGIETVEAERGAEKAQEESR